MQTEMAAEKPTAAMNLKLLVDTKAQRVLYAEGSKDVVEFLFSLLAIPLGAVTKLLTAGDMVGSVGNIYGSVDKVAAAADYVCRGDIKAALQASTTAFPPPGSSSRATNGGALYRCVGCTCSRNCYNYVTNLYGTPCPVCKGKMTTEVHLVEPDEISGGAKIVTAPAAGVVSYTVMDDLTVAPSSTVSVISALLDHGVADISKLQEKTVEVGYEEGLAVLKASLQSNTVLTDVFLGAKQNARRRPPVLL